MVQALICVFANGETMATGMGIKIVKPALEYTDGSPVPLDDAYVAATRFRIVMQHGETRAAFVVKKQPTADQIMGMFPYSDWKEVWDSVVGGGLSDRWAPFAKIYWPDLWRKLMGKAGVEYLPPIETPRK
ncbi:hypothetical protein RGQ15_10390 [Paracoccus sp. MBLB3053]|uniref:ASCH domain-containing protein n=1 Tax=Paracoccus aurantius TaxID=3073814 RepID=A0ABU2HSE8_9RHOB|nr:hypothetical protein [Paracoccus sp. MBLB3053]MDS9467973.1 hypothetical protein [Paracoccus sp. MBLB3053]